MFDLKALQGHHMVSVTVGLIALAIALWAPLYWRAVLADGARPDGTGPLRLGRPAQQGATSAIERRSPQARGDLS